MSTRAERYRAAGWWCGTSLPERLGEHAARRPTANAVTAGGRTVRYGELWELAGELGAALGELPARAVVLIVMPNGIEWAVAHAAIGRRGWIPASIPATTSVEHLAHAISLTGVRLVVVDAARAPAATAAVAAAGAATAVAVVGEGNGVGWCQEGGDVAAVELPPDAAQLFFTSSTTGPPKAVLHTHDTLAAMHTLMAERFGLDATTPILMPSPFGHSVGAMHGVRMAQWIGAELVTMPAWDATETLRLAAAHRPVYTAAATPFLVDLVEAAWDGADAKLASVRWFLCGGAAVPPELVRRARAELPATTVTPLWGMTEGGVTTCTEASTPAQFERTVGTPMPGLEVAVLEAAGAPAARGDGELVMRGPAVFTGYVGEPERYAAELVGDGWFRTGDLAHLDGDGYVSIVGRVKDLIVRGGVNISPIETEHALMSHPDIRAAAVVGWPDVRLGERLCAVVELARPDAHLTLDDVLDHCRAAGLSRRLLPERLTIVHEFPRTAAGKIRKPQLLAELKEGVMHDVTIDDIDVRYRTWGDGPPVVLVHGLAEDSGSWSAVARGITGRTVYAYDLRGHGGTTLGRGTGTLEQLGADLLGFLAAVTGPAPVVGFSLGGTVVLWAATERPELVPHVIAIGTSSVVGRAAAEFFRTRIGQIEAGDLDGFRAGFADDNTGMIASDAEAAPVLTHRLAAVGDGGGYVNAASAMVGLNAEPLTPRLARLEQPLDVVVGSEDAFCPPKASQMILDAAPASRLHVIEGAGHLVTVDRPNALTALLDELLDERSGERNGERP